MENNFLSQVSFRINDLSNKKCKLLPKTSLWDDENQISK